MKNRQEIVDEYNSIIDKGKIENTLIGAISTIMHIGYLILEVVLDIRENQNEKKI